MTHDTIRSFKRVLGTFLTGVTVVTTRVDGEPVGLTVNSFTSVSLEPLLILICILRPSSSHEALQDAGRFTVSFLAADQQEASMIFAGAPNSVRFSRVATFDSPAGLPVIAGALAYLDADIVSAHDEGDHTLFVGRVTHHEVLEADRPPLLYYRGKYVRIAQDAQEGSA